MLQKLEFLGRGTYNQVYLERNFGRVIKIQIQREDSSDDRVADETDTPERSCRLWDQINPSLARALEIEVDGQAAWSCPYIVGRQSSDKEMALALIDIYNRTGRIVVDATSPMNFIATHYGKVICVDIALALAFGLDDKNVNKGLKRSPSQISLDYWEDLQSDFNGYFYRAAEKNPKSVAIIKTLLFIRLNNLDIFNADFLLINRKLVIDLARAYDGESKPKIFDDIWHAFRHTPLKNAKTACINILSPQTKTVEKRGSLFSGGNIYSELIQQLKQARNFDDMRKNIEDAHLSQELSATLCDIISREKCKHQSRLKAGFLNQPLSREDISYEPNDAVIVYHF